MTSETPTPVEQPAAERAPVEDPPTPDDAVESAAPIRDPLLPIERRILGVLVEKQKTSRTADAYPLTLNGLVTGCNQKSNRDPVLDLTDIDVEAGLSELQKKLLITRITGGRVERFKHNLYEAWTQNGPELAVLAELLLRGPQTRGDLRGRAGRMDQISTLDELDEILQSLAGRGLVVFLTDPHRRGALVSHGFHPPEELAGLREHPVHGPARASAHAAVRAPFAPPDRLAVLESRLDAALAEIESLRARLVELENTVAELRRAGSIEKSS